MQQQEQQPQANEREAGPLGHHQEQQGVAASTLEAGLFFQESQQALHANTFSAATPEESNEGQRGGLRPPLMLQPQRKIHGLQFPHIRAAADAAPAGDAAQAHV